MTYQQIYNAVSASRFDPTLIGAGTSTLPTVKDWIRAKEGEVWQYTDWPIKNSAQLNVTVTGGTATIPLPAGFSFPTQEISLYDNWGSRLDYMKVEDFYDQYQPAADLAQTGFGESWTYSSGVSGGVVTPAIRIGPTPGASTTFTVTGWTLPICRDTA